MIEIEKFKQHLGIADMPKELDMLISFQNAYWAMNKWLQDFAYRININWSVFAASGAVIILIAFAIISFQAIKTAITNPVKSLRTEL